MIYFAFVYSHSVYYIEIYANTYMMNINKLVILNKNIPALHNYQILKLVHKFTHHHDKLPAIFSNYFTKNYMFHSYNIYVLKIVSMWINLPALWANDQ